MLGAFTFRSRTRQRRAQFKDGERRAVRQALTAAHLYRGDIAPPPTIAKAAEMTGACVPYAEAMLTILASEDAELVDRVLSGNVPLVKAAAEVRKRAKL